MKKLFISALFVSFILIFSISSSAALVSPGISVIQKDVTMTKVGVAKNDIVFSAEDFKTALGAKENFSITVTTLPSVEDGVLKLGAVDVTPGETIPSEKISILRFIPSKAGACASFGFVPCDMGYKEEFTCSISMMTESISLSPITKSDKITDLSGISIFSVLPVEEKRDDLTFSIESGASHGVVEIINVSTGEYKYTPDEGFYGKDSFTFRAEDKNGNVSNVSKITVNVMKNEKNFVYSDMEDSSFHFAAAVLAKNDVMLGSKSGDKRVFDPQGKVTRSDFLIMAMNTAGIEVSNGESSFCDSDNFTPYEKKYISSAEALGIVVGIDTDDGRCFMPDKNITYEDAALIVCRIGALSGFDFVGKDVSVSVMSDEEYDALSILVNAGMVECEASKDEISREDTAGLLYSVLQYN